MKDEGIPRKTQRRARGMSMNYAMYGPDSENVEKSRIPIVVRVSSQKGGVGKTTVAINLSSALSRMGYRVLLIDGDTVNPTIGFLLGINDMDVGLKQVLSNRVEMRAVMKKHESTGVYLVLGDPAERSFLPTPDQLKVFIKKIGQIRDFDFVVIDTPPGFMSNPIEVFFEEALIVTTPTTAACSSAIRLAEFYETKGIRHELIINKTKNSPYEMSVSEVESACGMEAIGTLPEDRNISVSEDRHTPVCMLYTNSPFTKAIGALAKIYAAKRGTPQFGSDTAIPALRPGFLSWLLGWWQR